MKEPTENSKQVPDDVDDDVVSCTCRFQVMDTGSGPGWSRCIWRDPGCRVHPTQ